MPPATQHEFVNEISNWLDDKTTSNELAARLGVTRDWVDQLELVTDTFSAAVAAGAVGGPVTLTPPTGGAAVGDDDEVVVILDKVTIRRLFTDTERTERGNQEGKFYLEVNGRPTTLTWERELTSQRPKRWAAYESEPKTLLFAGKPKGALDIDIIVEEDDEPERAFFQRIADLLKTAAAFAGFLPGTGGTAVSAALNLGAAVAQLIKAKLQNDPEMRFLGTLGGSRFDLSYGDYTLTRHSQGGASPEIEAQFRVIKFEKTHLPKTVKIYLEDLEFADTGTDNSITNLGSEDRVLVDVTVTETPEDQDDDPRIGALKVDRPYFGENNASWPKTFSLQDRLLYDGDWGINIALNLNMSGIPRDINEEEWKEVVQQTGAFVSALADPQSQAAVRRGFEIAEAVRATAVKFLPKIRFENSLATALFVGDVIDGLFALQQNTDWQDISIELDLGNFGKAVFHLKVKLAF